MMKILSFTFCGGLTLACLSTLAADYHLDAEHGNDARDGLSPATAWRTLERASAATLKPGDRVLLRAGQTFPGTLRLDAEDAGTPQKPVTIGSFGQGRATIQAGLGGAVLVSNAGGVEVRDLICVGEDRTRNHGAGVAFVNSLPGNQRLRHVRIRNVEARGFGRELPKPKTLPEGFQLPQGAGILVAGNAKDGSKSGFEDVEISDCVCHDNAYYGILITGYWNAKATNYANARIHIADCRVFENPGDPLYHENHSGSGILVEDCDGGLVERCVAYENGALCHDAPGGPCGIWTAVARRVVIQECESFRNRTRAADGDGFDLDGGSIECVLQYNYSHDNDGAGFLVYTYAGAPHADRGNVVRWNVSENDARRNRQYGGICLGNSGNGMTGVQVYHNTVIMTRTNDLAECVVAVESRKIGVRFWNNLFIGSDGVPLVRLGEDHPGIVFQGNAYCGAGTTLARIGKKPVANLEAWRALGKETLDGQPLGRSLDLSLDLGAPRGRAGDLARLTSMNAFRPLKDSAAATAGLDLRVLFQVDPGPRDFSGRILADTAVLPIGALSQASSASSGNETGKREKQATRSFAPPKPVNYREPAREYVERQAGGWTFHIERELADRQPDVAERAVRRLETKLGETLALFPAHARDRLAKLRIFVMLGAQATGGGREGGAEYFRRFDPDFHLYLDPRWRSAVVIYSAANYVRQNEHWAVQMLLHEFAHAWHLEQWPEKQPDIFAAWTQAMAGRLYQGVKDVNGTVVAKAYAAHNQLEYFAEISCAYFHRGEYEPFDREALRRYDPVGFAMLEKMWGIHAPPPPPSDRAGHNE